MPRSNGVPLKFKDPLLYDTEEVDALYHSLDKLEIQNIFTYT